MQADIEEIELPAHQFSRDSLDLTRSHYFEAREESIKPPSAQINPLEQTLNNESLLDFEENRVQLSSENQIKKRKTLGLFFAFITRDYPLL